MEPQRVRVDEIDWRNAWPALRLLDCFGMAMHPSRMIPAVLGVWTFYLVARLLDLLPWLLKHDAAERFFVNAFVTSLKLLQGVALGFVQSLLHLEFVAFFRGLRTVASHLESHVRLNPWWCLLALTVTLLLLPLFGGMVARSAALQAARREQLAFPDALRYMWRRYLFYFSAPLLPVGFVCVIAILIGIVGLLFNFPGGDLVGALAYPFMLVGGLLIAILLVGLLLSFGLIYPAIALDDADPFDACSRAASYALGRPIHLLGYSALALAVGSVSYLIVALVCNNALGVVHAILSAAVFTPEFEGGPDRLQAMLPVYRGDWQWADPDWMTDFEALGGTRKVAGVFMLGVAFAFLSIIPAYAASFYLCAQTRIYQLLREATDGVAFDEIVDLPSLPERAEPVAAATSPAPPEPGGDASGGDASGGDESHADSGGRGPDGPDPKDSPPHPTTTT